MTTTTTRQVHLADGVPVEIRIAGTGPVPVVALAGGAAASIDFFPGLRRLRGATVVEHDRVGTGRTPERPSGPATLTSAAADLHALRVALDMAPVVVIAQSFGGAVWAQWLVDYPDDIAGAVIIDPTPFNAPKTITSLVPTTRVLGFATTTPLLRSAVGTLLERAVDKAVDRAHPDLPAARAALLETTQWRRMATQFRTLPQQCADLTDRLATHPSHTLVVGANRKPNHRIRLAHEDLCHRTGARYEVWPGAVHAEHLRQPQRVLDAVQSVVNGVRSR